MAVERSLFSLRQNLTKSSEIKVLTFLFVKKQIKKTKVYGYPVQSKNYLQSDNELDIPFRLL